MERAVAAGGEWLRDESGNRRARIGLGFRREEVVTLPEGVPLLLDLLRFVSFWNFHKQKKITDHRLNANHQ